MGQVHAPDQTVQVGYEGTLPETLEHKAKNSRVWFSVEFPRTGPDKRARGPNEVAARNGSDVGRGGSGKDRLQGGEGNDDLFGGPNSDYLNGDDGWDELYGGDGPDAIEPGRRPSGGDGERDYINCGPGKDTVQYAREDKVVNCENKLIFG